MADLRTSHPKRLTEPILTRFVSFTFCGDKEPTSYPLYPEDELIEHHRNHPRAFTIRFLKSGEEVAIYRQNLNKSSVVSVLTQRVIKEATKPTGEMPDEPVKGGINQGI